MFPVSFNVSLIVPKLINTLVDLQRFRSEFRAFHSIMRVLRQILATKTTVCYPGHDSNP